MEHIIMEQINYGIEQSPFSHGWPMEDFNFYFAHTHTYMHIYIYYEFYSTMHI